MPPNSKGEKLVVTECAVPFKDEQSGSAVAKTSSIQNGNPSAFVSLRPVESHQAETSLRVNIQRHQYTYELDKYRKNAMLVLHYDNVYPGSRETVNKVKSTFEKFRFEVEVHHNATGDEVKAISETFFQRDFCEYGAVGIVVIGNVNNDGKFSTPEADFTDRDILDHLISNLQSKPKIVIFECDRMPERYYSTYTDVIDYIFPVIVYTSTEPNGVCHPLSFYCDKVDALADQESLQTILLGVIDEAKKNNWKKPPAHLDGALITDIHQKMILQLHTRMPKELYLWRNSGNHTL